jgi:hypothetical protein
MSIPESREVLAHSDRRELHGRSVAIAFIMGAWIVVLLVLLMLFWPHLSPLFEIALHNLRAAGD